MPNTKSVQPGRRKKEDGAKHTDVCAKVCGGLHLDIEVLIDFADDFDGVADREMRVLWLWWVVSTVAGFPICNRCIK